MKLSTVRTAEQAVDYMTNCVLATVEHMALTHGRKEGEFQRQKDIAQFGITFMSGHSITPTGRAYDVSTGYPSVYIWAGTIDVKRGR